MLSSYQLTLDVISKNISRLDISELPNKLKRDIQVKCLLKYIYYYLLNNDENTLFNLQYQPMYINRYLEKTNFFEYPIIIHDSDSESEHDSNSEDEYLLENVREDENLIDRMNALNISEMNNIAIQKSKALPIEIANNILSNITYLYCKIIVNSIPNKVKHLRLTGTITSEHVPTHVIILELPIIFFPEKLHNNLTSLKITGFIYSISIETLLHLQNLKELQCTPFNINNLHKLTKLQTFHVNLREIFRQTSSLYFGHVKSLKHLILFTNRGVSHIPKFTIEGLDELYLESFALENLSVNIINVKYKLRCKYLCIKNIFDSIITGLSVTDRVKCFNLQGQCPRIFQEIIRVVETLCISSNNITKEELRLLSNLKSLILYTDKEMRYPCNLETVQVHNIGTNGIHVNLQDCTKLTGIIGKGKCIIGVFPKSLKWLYLDKLCTYIHIPYSLQMFITPDLSINIPYVKIMIHFKRKVFTNTPFEIEEIIEISPTILMRIRSDLDMNVFNNFMNFFDYKYKTKMFTDLFQ